MAAGWIPVVAGDLNAHTVQLPDWPAWDKCVPRISADTAVDALGELLLQFCRDMGARIVNGRAGDSSGASASFGARGTANSAVDFFIVPAACLQQVRSLLVDGVVEERAADQAA